MRTHYKRQAVPLIWEVHYKSIDSRQLYVGRNLPWERYERNHGLFSQHWYSMAHAPWPALLLRRSAKCFISPCLRTWGSSHLSYTSDWLACFPLWVRTVMQDNLNIDTETRLELHFIVYFVPTVRLKTDKDNTSRSSWEFKVAWRFDKLTAYFMKQTRPF
jgi:hypothetical protein